MNVDREIECCDKAIENAQNIKKVLLQFQSLSEKLQGEPKIEIVGNFQARPTVNVAFWEKKVGTYYNAGMKVRTLKNNTRFAFEYWPGCSNNRGYYDGYEMKDKQIQDEFHKYTKNLTYEQLQKLLTQFDKWMDWKEATKLWQQCIKEFKLSKDFK